jgi:hypothetical protein
MVVGDVMSMSGFLGFVFYLKGERGFFCLLERSGFFACCCFVTPFIIVVSCVGASFYVLVFILLFCGVFVFCAMRSQMFKVVCRLVVSL